MPLYLYIWFALAFRSDALLDNPLHFPDFGPVQEIPKYLIKNILPKIDYNETFQSLFFPLWHIHQVKISLSI